MLAAILIALASAEAREPSLMGSYLAHTASPLFLGLTLDESEIHSHGQAPGVVAGVACTAPRCHAGACLLTVLNF
jgi:hypothetical protein